MPDSEDILSALSRETESYLETVEELERKRKPGEGIFGMRGGPADNPCHERYSETVRQVLEELYTAPILHRKPLCAYWMLIAVQRHSLGLIDRLSTQDAKALFDRYSKDTPRHERLPVQNEILKKLIQR